MRNAIELPWSEFKTQCLDAGWQFMYFQRGDTYFIYANQNSFFILCKIVMDDGADHVEFETMYQPGASSNIRSNVSTQFERQDIVLKLAHCDGQADGNGDLELTLKVPGTFGVDYRYAAGGYAITDSYSWTDKISKVEIIDVDNVLGQGANYIAKRYHDSEVDSANQGWPFWKSHGSEGECEIEPMGWYGHLPAELYLRVTLKVAPNANVKCLIWWGKEE